MDAWGNGTGGGKLIGATRFGRLPLPLVFSCQCNDGGRETPFCFIGYSRVPEPPSSLAAFSAVFVGASYS